MEIKDTDKILNSFDNYITYLHNNPREINRINNEFEGLWSELKEIEKDIYI